MWRLPSIPPFRFAAGISLLLYLMTPLFSRAESSISFITIEESKYLLKGEGFKEITRTALTVDYDTTYLNSPQVNVMGGNLLEEDGGAAAPPGNLRLQIVNEDHNDVFEVCVYFQKSGDYPAVINFVTAEVTDQSGDRRPVPVEMVVSPDPPPSEAVPAEPAPASDPASPSLQGAAESPAQESDARTETLSPAEGAWFR